MQMTKSQERNMQKKKKKKRNRRAFQPSGSCSYDDSYCRVTGSFGLMRLQLSKPPHLRLDTTVGCNYQKGTASHFSGSGILIPTVLW